jgi:hypothetical protein
MTSNSSTGPNHLGAAHPSNNHTKKRAKDALEPVDWRRSSPAGGYDPIICTIPATPERRAEISRAAQEYTARQAEAARNAHILEVTEAPSAWGVRELRSLGKTVRVVPSARPPTPPPHDEEELEKARRAAKRAQEAKEAEEARRTEQENPYNLRPRPRTNRFYDDSVWLK